MNRYDLIVVGSGAAGIMAALTATKTQKKVLLLEKLPKIGVKLKATGGGRCNLTNTLCNEDFMNAFGHNGKFMMKALEVFNHQDLINFFTTLGVQTHSLDGFRVFPTTHNSLTILNALTKELQKRSVEVQTNQKVISITPEKEVITTTHKFFAKKVVIATGGVGYPQLGGGQEGFSLARDLQHTVTDLFPAMTPLITKERWVEKCRADTLAKVEIQIDLKKYKKLKKRGDLIFSKDGIRGPVVLDFAREITPLIKQYGEVPIVLNLLDKNLEELLQHFKKYSTLSLLESIKLLLPEAISNELIQLVQGEKDLSFKKQRGAVRESLLHILRRTPLTIIGTDGFQTAMVTRGGIALKEVDPQTMQSKLHDGIYFCGEVLDLDGPCGGYNLQWSFASGYLAGQLL